MFHVVKQQASSVFKLLKLESIQYIIIRFHMATNVTNLATEKSAKVVMVVMKDSFTIRVYLLVLSKKTYYLIPCIVGRQTHH